MVPIDLEGRNALVVGAANHRSLAWAIASQLGAAGARVALSYQGERLKGAVEELAAGLDRALVLPCDVGKDDEIESLFAAVKAEMPHLDVLVHSVAFARREDLQGHYRDTSREGWRVALEISAFSLVALARHAAPLMAHASPPAGGPDAEAAAGRGGSILTLSYVAAERAVPNYNVMGSAKAALEHAVRQLAYELGPDGIRVNAISAGPVATLSARGISGFSEMARHHREKACLQRNITPEEVASAALFLASDLGSGVTGETLHVDAGYSIVGW